MSISEHTRLVNKVIGLCKDTACWPSFLYDLGYNIQLVEQTISLRESAQKITPDMVAVSNKLVHAMVIDCKVVQILIWARIKDTNRLSRAT